MEQMLHDIVGFKERKKVHQCKEQNVIPLIRKMSTISYSLINMGEKNVVPMCIPFALYN